MRERGVFTPEEALACLCAKAKEFKVEPLANRVLEEPKFLIWSGSGQTIHHHYGKGGLVVHTWEVVRLALQTNEIIAANVCPRKLFLTGLYHDVGKMWDYKPTNVSMTVWTSTQHRSRIHHITRSVKEWGKAFDAQGPNCFSPEQIETVEDDVIHGILAHHGRLEWHSPVEPRTKLAFLIHYCDAISARMDDADRLFAGAS